MSIVIRLSRREFSNSSIFQIWSFYHSLIILIITVIISTVIHLLLYFNYIKPLIVCISTVVPLLTSVAVVVITFKSIKKSTVISAKVMRAEKVLLYQTAFVALWLSFSQIADYMSYYFTESLHTHPWIFIFLICLYNSCILLSNPGSLLFLLYMSSTVRNEFYKTFGFLQQLKSKKQAVSGSLTAAS